MPKTRAGKRIASVSDACATAFPAVRAIPAAAAAKTAVPARAPVNAAPEREARRPERAAENSYVLRRFLKEVAPREIPLYYDH